MTCIHRKIQPSITCPVCTTGIAFQVFRSTFISVMIRCNSYFLCKGCGERELKSLWEKILIFHLLHAACKHLLPTLGSCEIPVRMMRQFKYTMHICICPSNVKCNISISTCTIGWTVILCTSCCVGSCTKLEATKLNPLKR